MSFKNAFGIYQVLERLRAPNTNRVPDYLGHMYRPGIRITDDGKHIVIDLPQLTLTIETK